MFDTPEPSRTLKVVFGALVFTLGAQSMRFLFGSITWYLRDTLGFATLDLVPIALAPFVLGAIIPLLVRWLSVRGALGLGVWLLVVARLVNQVIDSPSLDFITAAVGTMAFVGLLPLMMSMGRSAMVGGVLLGIALDSAIKGMGLSLDLALQDGIAPVVAVFALAAATVYLLWAAPPVEREGVTWGSGVLLVGIGPFLFFEMLVLQNQGWTSEVAQIGAAQAQLRIALLNVVALLAVGWWERNRLATGLAGAALVATLLLAENGALAFNLLSLVAVPAAGLVWAGMVPDPDARGMGASITYLTAGMVLFIGFGLAYYVPMDLRLGFDQQAARVGAAIVLALFALGTMGARVRTRPGATRQTWAFAALASVLALFGLFQGIRGGGVESGASYVRFLSYNIHSSYDVEGRFDIEAIAEVIGDSGATVVGLQEVPRGRLLSGVTDELSILATRLGFEHVAFFGTTDPTWGNAILSRFPIVSVDRAYLPEVGTPLRRGYLGARLDLGGGRELLFISTHLQHVNDSEVHDEDPEGDLYPVHTQQIESIISEWGGYQPAVMAGDFNARPDWRQIEELLAAGWVDSWAEAGEGEGFTSNSLNPQYRIDYIFHTPDLVAADAGVIQSRASDHFAVAADIQGAD